MVVKVPLTLTCKLGGTARNPRFGRADLVTTNYDILGSAESAEGQAGSGGRLI